MYNKYIFINNNRRKKQKELEEKTKQEEPQISFDILMQENIKQKDIKVSESTNKISNSLTTMNNRKNLNKFVDDYVLVDIETTGLSPITDEIIEIGAIKVKQNKIVDKYNELIKVNRVISPFITNLTGITNEMLQTGKNPITVYKEFIDFIGENVIIGHNVNFDLGFLTDKCKKYINYNLTNDYVDTMYLARKLVKDTMNYKLGTLAEYFNVSYEGAHRGLKDVEITYEVYNCLRKI